MKVLEIGTMRGYKAADGTVYLQVEAVAVGLGYTYRTKSGEMKADIKTLNNLLKEMKYTAVKAGSYVAENVFYRLAMRANSEGAEKFQSWIADEVIPTIRRSGRYEVGQQAAMRLLSKENRKEETSEIQRSYIPNARKHGDYRPEGLIYALLTKKANELAGIPKGGRDYASAAQLATLILGEKAIAQAIRVGVAAGDSNVRIDAAIEAKHRELSAATKGLLG